MAENPDPTQNAPEGTSSSSARDRRRDGPPPTPFDHPFFLPVLFAGFALWFGYDGWITTDPDMLEHQTFNQYGFFVLVALFVLTTFRAVRETRAAAEKPPESGATEADRADTGKR